MSCDKVLRLEGERHTNQVQDGPQGPDLAFGLQFQSVDSIVAPVLVDLQ